MKQIFILLVVLAVIASCSKDDKQKLDPLIKVTGVSRLPQLRSGEINDSLAFITRYAWKWSAFSKKYNQSVKRAFGLGGDDMWLSQRDTLNNKLLLLDVDVIMEGELGGFVVDHSDVVLLGVKQPGEDKLIHPKDQGSVGDMAKLIDDTIGYIPNRVILDAREKITKAFNAGDYIECQRLFNEAYVFIPTTGAKWRAMKAAGIE